MAECGGGIHLVNDETQNPRRSLKMCLVVRLRPGIMSMSMGKLSHLCATNIVYRSKVHEEYAHSIQSQHLVFTTQ